MKAAVLAGPSRIEIRDIPKPEIKDPRDVLLRVVRAGICGSDLHYYVPGYFEAGGVAYPLVPGHECTAVIEEIGSGVSRLRPGMRAAVDPAIACGRCDQCRAGRPHTCRNIGFLGFPGQLVGGLAEFISVPEANVFPLPDGVSFEEGALVEPLAIGMYAVSLAGGTPGKSVGILGAGPIGLCVLLAARAEGCGPVFVTDKVEDRLRAAAETGASWTRNPDDVDMAEDIPAREPAGLDLVFECCGDQAALDQALAVLNPGGKLLVLGIPPASRISFDAGRLRRHEISIIHVRRQNGFTGRAVEAVASGLISPAFLATHQFPLDRTQDAFILAASRADGALKVMVSP
ncbi:MAG: alcohol dehydrogenase catalytic domain-containing protein [Acidobacteriota bacterium]|nr:alcohol dehydrogenase catalytic domain-containing protein [Acidobacteriota bacterium]